MLAWVLMESILGMRLGYPRPGEQAVLRSYHAALRAEYLRLRERSRARLHACMRGVTCRKDLVCGDGCQVSFAASNGVPSRPATGRVVLLRGGGRAG